MSKTTIGPKERQVAELRARRLAEAGMKRPVLAHKVSPPSGFARDGAKAAKRPVQPRKKEPKR